MCPPTEPPDAEGRFAARILHELLHQIEVRNANAAAYPRAGRLTFTVSHAWVDGPSIRLVYVTPPSDRSWGLARDTRRSLVDPGPWTDADDPARYYYLLDLEEDWPGATSREPGEDPDLIWWLGYPLDDLPGRLSKLPRITDTHHRHLTRRGSTTRPHLSRNRAATQTPEVRFRRVESDVKR